MPTEEEIQREADEKAIELFKIKKLITSLQRAKGNGTSMISLIMPPKSQISITAKMLGDEYGTASNIKSRVNRLSVLTAITSAQQRLKLYNRCPDNGLVIYCGSAPISSIKNIDAEYLVTNKQFKAAFAMIMEESVKWMNEAKKDPLWTNSGAWAKMNNFQTASDGAEVRQAVKDLMGDVWTKRVLGF